MDKLLVKICIDASLLKALLLSKRKRVDVSIHGVL
jgi:hypothetical protein